MDVAKLWLGRNNLMRITIFTRLLLTIAVLFCGGIGLRLANATEIIDPDTGLIDPNFFICPDGAAIGTCGADPNHISQNKFGIYVETPTGPQNPFLLILGIPSTNLGVAQAAPAGGTVDATSFSIGGTNAFLSAVGQGWDVGTGLAKANGGKFEPIMPKKPYDWTCVQCLIGLRPPGDYSENPTNWFGARETTLLGYMPSFFSIYVYRVEDTLPDKVLKKVTFASPIPMGSYVVGYGQDPKHVYATPFTTAGFVDTSCCKIEKTPEPSSLLLIGTGLLGWAAMWRKRRSTPQVVVSWRKEA